MWTRVVVLPAEQAADVEARSQALTDALNRLQAAAEAAGHALRTDEVTYRLYRRGEPGCPAVEYDPTRTYTRPQGDPHARVMRVDCPADVSEATADAEENPSDLTSALYRDGVDVLTLVEHADGPVCGGPLRRHHFPPGDGERLRDLLLDSSTCIACGEHLTRQALVEQAAAEATRGTCGRCGRVLTGDGTCPGGH